MTGVGPTVIDAELVIVPDPRALACEAAQRVSGLARQAAGARGRFSLALSGGSTPGALYRLLAEEPYRTHIPWSQVHLCWADERCVPPGDPSRTRTRDSGRASAQPAQRACVPI